MPLDAEPKAAKAFSYLPVPASTCPFPHANKVDTYVMPSNHEWVKSHFGVKREKKSNGRRTIDVGKKIERKFLADV